MSARELFSANLRLIDAVARSVCLRRRMNPADIEDFLSTAKLALIEDDYAILSRYEGRSSLATFLAAVFDNMIWDQRVHAMGRWHPSRAAQRMGPAGILLETLLRRDGRSIEEALPLVTRVDAAVTREQIVSMAAEFPERTPRARVVPLDPEVEITVAAADASDARTVERERHAVAARTSEVIRSAIDAFEPADRMLIRLHFGSKISIADIARMLRLPGRPLYRRLQARLGDLRQALDAAGLDSRSVIDLIGAVTEVNFGLETSETMENEQVRRSLEAETAQAGEAI